MFKQEFVLTIKNPKKEIEHHEFSVFTEDLEVTQQQIIEHFCVSVSNYSLAYTHENIVSLYRAVKEFEPVET